MVTVAEEMTRQGMNLPLLIGGATTSKVHTALRIAPRYNGTTVHVLDASRAVGVCSALVSESGSQAEDFAIKVAAEYEAIRVERAGGTKEKVIAARGRARQRLQDRLVGLHAAQAGDHRHARLRRISAARAGRAHRLDAVLPRLGAGRQLSGDPRGSRRRRQRRASSMPMRARCSTIIVREKWLTAKGVVTFWPCRRDGDDVVLYSDETRTKEISRLYFLRQQIEKRAPRANMCLADFISPEADWIGGFAVTAGHGIEEHLARFKADHDDYSDILLKALADRLAEAFAERLHERVRKTLWGYAPDEALTNDELTREKYRGIRPAPGYPACPDHSQKPELFRLLNAGQNAGIHAHRELRDDADLGGLGLLLRPSRRAVFRRRPHRPGPGRGLRRAPRRFDRAGREVAAPEHWLLIRSLTYALVLVVGFAAGTVSGIVGTEVDRRLALDQFSGSHAPSARFVNAIGFGKFSNSPQPP